MHRANAQSGADRRLSGPARAGSDAEAMAREPLRPPLRIQVAFDWDAFVVYARALWRYRLAPGGKIALWVIPALLLGAALQEATPPIARLWGAVFCLPAVLVAYCVRAHGPGPGLAAAFAAGILQDSLAGTPLGLSGCAYVLGTVLAHAADSRWGRRPRLSALLSAAIVALVSILGPGLVVRFQGDGAIPAGRLAVVAFGSALLAGAVLAPLVFQGASAGERLLGIRRGGEGGA